MLVVLAPHLSGDELTVAMASATSLAGVDLRDRRLDHQCRHHDPDPPSDQERDDVLDRVLFLADLRARRPRDLAVRLGQRRPATEFAVLAAIGFLGGTAHILLTESYRYASASVVAPFDYTSMIWALVLGYAMFGETPTS